MASYNNDWKIEAKREPCETLYDGGGACGTDGKDYPNVSSLECEQKREYGKRVNLQLWHIHPCLIWERYGLATSTFCFVS